MKTHLHARLPRAPRPNAFALVITLSLLVLLAVVGVGMLSLSALALRSSSLEQAQHEARANARLALFLAIGELQQHLGPDQRVSAPAGILDSNAVTPEIDGVEHPWWTAVWSTRWTSTGANPANVTPWVRNDADGGGGLSDRRFTGTYDRKKQVLAYLVSGNEGTRASKPESAFIDALTTRLPENETIVLVGPGTLGSEAVASGTAKQVVAKRVSTTDGSRPSGAYAYWVGDVGVKANVVQVDRFSSTKPKPGAADGMQRLLNAQDTAEEMILGFGRIEDSEAARICSEKSIGLAKETPKPKVQARFHDITRESRSVLANVRLGGLQRDLTAYLNDADGKIPELKVAGKQVAWGITDLDKIAGPANQWVASEQGTTWDKCRYRDLAPSFAMLRRWHLLGQNLTFTTAKRSQIAPVRDTRTGEFNDAADVYDGANMSPARFLPLDEPNLSPVMTEGSIYYNLATYPSQAGSATSTHNLRVCLYPRVALWNPYNVHLDVGRTVAQFFVNGNKEVEVSYVTGAAPRIVSIPFGRGSTKVPTTTDGAVSSEVDNDPGRYVGTLLFSLPPITLAPGETLVFSPDKSAEYKLDSTFLNTLSPSVAPDPTRYYWQDMRIKHAQIPLRFIEKPGSGTSSGADNYLIALKDASSGGNVTNRSFNNLPLIVYANGSLQAGGNDEPPVFWNSATPVPVYPLASTAAVLPGAAVPDVRTRDGMRLRWWHEHPSNKAGSGSLAGHPQHLQSAVIGNWNPRAAYFCRNPWDNVSNLAPNLFGCYTRDLFDQEVSWASMAPRSRNGKMLGNPFGPPLEGNDQLVLFEVPRKETGIPSLGYLRHLKLSEFGWHPSYVIGNSLADPRVGRRNTNPVLSGSELSNNGWNQTFFGSGRGSAADYWANLHREILFSRTNANYVVYDLSYEVNFNLWDDYFLSTGTAAQKRDFIQNPVANPLPNGRMALLAQGPNVESKLNDFHLAATQLLIDGGFNVHSISKEAWKAVLASTADTGFGSEGAVPFPRLLNPPAGEWLNGAADDKPATSGFRSLTKDEIDTLAGQIVREVKERAPFFGLADFVNRRLVDSKHGDKGPLQAAIDATTINAKFEQAFPLDNTKALPNVSFDGMPDTTRLDQTRLPKSTAWGLPGYLTQGDLLQVIGSTLTPRSDTFMVRAYGESVDADGKVLARAWCEGMVQRTPEPLTPDEAGLNPAPAQTGRTDFGRRFRLISFRWLAPGEV